MPVTQEISPICARDQHPSPQRWLRDSKKKSLPVAYVAKKDMRQRARQGYAKHVESRKIQQWMRVLSRELATAKPEQHRAYVERRFGELAAQWEAETRHISSLTDMSSHQSYKRIIKLGWDVVPFLLKDLQQNCRFWFPALAEITKIQPFDSSDVGNGKRMTEAWLQWGLKKGLI